VRHARVAEPLGLVLDHAGHAFSSGPQGPAASASRTETAAR
jgi:hypothetical protein